jgi:hypothetical protein
MVESLGVGGVVCVTVWPSDMARKQFVR